MNQHLFPLKNESISFQEEKLSTQGSKRQQNWFTFEKKTDFKL